ncbi:hypothetical protein DE146DRAFT_625606 [Phaeosphaeria sp. MPI-PUGE-AT-0046c]|nr:hypothetical protein DE146DRAFT_625606 [Phaeosphaeria sp. MPI-PUGE-AT-0046c]
MVAPVQGCVASCSSIGKETLVEEETAERFKTGHDMPTTPWTLWLASSSTWKTGLFRWAVCIGPKSHCASCHGWVFSCKRRAVLFWAPPCCASGQSLGRIALHGILAQ